jgi:hypothetical protein
MAAAELRVLCDAANAAAGDTEKVRAHGVRAVGALLAAWQPCWGLDSSRSSSSVGGSGTVSSDSSSSVSSNAQPAAAAAAAGAAAGTTAPTEDWSWVAGWFKAAFGSLQSCLAARSMKVVWNAAVAAAAGLHNTAATLAVPAVADSNPGLLRMLVVLVRDSSNYKIKTHAAAALAAPPDRGVYGEVFADSLLVLLAALQALQGSSSSSSSSSALVAAAADGQQAGVGGESGLDDEGAFPNYRCGVSVDNCHLAACALLAHMCATQLHIAPLSLSLQPGVPSSHSHFSALPVPCIHVSMPVDRSTVDWSTTGTSQACRHSWSPACVTCCPCYSPQTRHACGSSCGGTSRCC